MKIKIEGLTGKRMGLTSGYGKFSRPLPKLLGNPENEDSEVRIWIGPPWKRQLPKGFNISFTMHETDTLNDDKKDWVDNLNQHDLIFTPTSWNKNVFIKLGVKKPIEVVPLGVNEDIFRGAKSEEFSILTMHENFGSNTSRENWRSTLEVYMTAFSGIADTHLFIKTWNYQEGSLDINVRDIADKLQLRDSEIPQISLITDELSDEELSRLNLSVWMFVKNANREGWSLPLNESLSCGIYSVYRRLPALSWAREYGAIPFTSDIELMGLMLAKYSEYKLIKEVRNKYSIKRTAAMIKKYVSKYYKGV